MRCVIGWHVGLPPDEQPDPWNDFSRPATEIENATVAADVGRRQALYVEYLRALLEQSSVLEEFTYFLRRSLAVGRRSNGTALGTAASARDGNHTYLASETRARWRQIDGVGMNSTLLVCPCQSLFREHYFPAICNSRRLRSEFRPKDGHLLVPNPWPSPKHFANSLRSRVSPMRCIKRTRALLDCTWKWTTVDD